MRTSGDRFGLHRVVRPQGVLPQQADELDFSLPIFDNELLIDVEALNIDSASFHQIREFCGSNLEKMKAHIHELVAMHGKHHNPVTGSGGMLLGTVKQVGVRFFDNNDAGIRVQPGDRIATLVSLTLTPLKLHHVHKIHMEKDRIDVEAQALLFQSGIFAKLPSDIPEGLALAVLDVCGAPAQTQNICKPGQTVVVIGGAGKSGVLCLYQARKAVGPAGRVIALDYSPKALNGLDSLDFIDAKGAADARDALSVRKVVDKLTGGRMADVVINVTNIPDTEMSCILSCRNGGIVYFFSMATSFTKATLGAEGVGANVQLIMGNGYFPGHADLTLNILRESTSIRAMYEARYGAS